jgi:hypothetical protein
MKAKIYYQDFLLNAGVFNNKDLKMNVDKATYITTLEFDVFSKNEFADNAFREMNIGETVNYPSLRSNFNRAGHTSMSIGDYIKFEDGTTWIVAPIGWDFTKVKNY